MALTPGDIAPGIAKKSDMKLACTRRIIDILICSLKSETEVSEEILESFRSYRRLSKWQDKNLGIAPMAENTLRKNLEILFPGGLRGFEESRQKLFKKALSQSVKPGTKTAYQQTASKLREENQVLVNHIFQFSAQYLDLFEKAVDTAQAHKFLQEEIKSHIRAYPNAYRGLRVVRESKNGR